MATNFPDTSVDNTFVTPNRPWADGDEFDDTANSGLIYYWYDPVWKTKASDVTAADLTVSSLNGGQLAGFRNQIINGDFRVAQRGTSGFTNEMEYTLDRWKTRDNNREAVNVGQMSVDVPGHPQAIRYIATTGAPSGGVDNIIELPTGYTNGAFAPGSTWTLSYWCTKPLTTAIQAQNTSDVEGVQHRATGGDVQTLDTYNTFTRYSRTFTIGTTPFDNAKTCLKIVFTEGVLPADFILTGVQLEPGPVATPFEHRPYGTELALCQRYYEKRITNSDSTSGGASDQNGRLTLAGCQTQNTNGTNGSAQFAVQFNVEKRVAPSINVGFIKNSGVYAGQDQNDGTPEKCVSWTLDNTTRFMANINVNYPSMGGGTIPLQWTRYGDITPEPYIEMNAEL